MKGRGDLHTHTAASDGQLKPRELIHLAKEKGLAALAITDHDTVDGLKEALKAGRDYGIEVIPGIELSTEWEGRDVHLLGYYIDFEDDRLRKFLVRLQEARYRRGQEMVTKLRELGYDLRWEEVTRFVKGNSVGRVHVAQALVDKGLVPSVEVAFTELLERGRPAYVPRYKILPGDAIELIRMWGGVAVLAHPGLIGCDGIVEELVSRGLEGLEVYYPLHDEQTTERYLNLAQRMGLLITGGSDFHGTQDQEHAQLGAVTVGEKEIGLLKERAKKRNDEKR
ncbi:MAG: PHP domain-containing protein [Thermanaeromonas sp.]|uniref:PHP domain-containing protein n=1 Tax=Thermanaeromonas sp. TaxID=2003697 RepID=UPI00243765A0|nr:PHP domain-containing protein [Thermanaeromonas sp.]MCG0278331.1 PHP domain-containing protein [Thermanaeromonas sp.]